MAQLAPTPEELGSRSLPTKKEAAAVALLHMEMAETSLADYEKMDRRGEPPRGVIARTATPMEGDGVRIMDVWESQEDLERFEEEQIMPVARDVWGEPSGAPRRRDIVEIHELWTR